MPLDRRIDAARFHSLMRWFAPWVQRQCRLRSLHAEFEDVLGHALLKYVQHKIRGTGDGQRPVNHENAGLGDGSRSAQDETAADKMLACWLKEVAINRIHDLQRNRRRCPEQCTSDLEQSMIPDRGPSCDSDPGSAAVLKEAVNELEKRKRRVVELRFFEGMANEEIAISLGWSMGTIRSLMYRAKNDLRRDPRLRRLVRPQ